MNTDVGGDGGRLRFMRLPVKTESMVEACQSDDDDTCWGLERREEVGPAWSLPDRASSSSLSSSSTLSRTPSDTAFLEEDPFMVVVAYSPGGAAVHNGKMTVIRGQIRSSSSACSVRTIDYDDERTLVSTTTTA
jgi:hypothetical protein